MYEVGSLVGMICVLGLQLSHSCRCNSNSSSAGYWNFSDLGLWYMLVALLQLQLVLDGRLKLGPIMKYAPSLEHLNRFQSIQSRYLQR